MNRTLLLLGLAVVVFLVMSVTAVVLKATVGLALILAAFVAILVLGGWALLRGRRGPYG